MKKIIGRLPTLVFLVFTFSCNQAHYEKSVAKDMLLADTAGRWDALASPGANAEAEDSPPLSRKFIRTAELHFKVKEVQQSVNEIEKTTRSLGGFVALSHFRHQVNDSTVTAVSADSSLVKINYSAGAVLLLRVPDERMDSLLALLGPLSSFTAMREVTCEDASLRLLESNLSRRRSLESAGRLSRDIDQKGRKLPDMTAAEDAIEEKQGNADASRIAGLKLNEEVHFSKVSVSLYGDPGTMYAKVPRALQPGEFSPPFLSRMEVDMKGGWGLLEALLIFVAGIWPLLLVLGCSWLLFRRYSKTILSRIPGEKI